MGAQKIATGVGLAGLVALFVGVGLPAIVPPGPVAEIEIVVPTADRDWPEPTGSPDPQPPRSPPPARLDDPDQRDDDDDNGPIGDAGGDDDGDEDDDDGASGDDDDSPDDDDDDDDGDGD